MKIKFFVLLIFSFNVFANYECTAQATATNEIFYEIKSIESEACKEALKRCRIYMRDQNLGGNCITLSHGPISSQPVPEPIPEPDPVPSEDNFCRWTYDGACDDGREGSSTSLCPYGSDESDCSNISSLSCRWTNDGACDDGRPGSSTSICAYGTDENDCAGIDFSNSCRWANDNYCDDGRAGSFTSLCEWGSDENDCNALKRKVH